MDKHINIFDGKEIVTVDPGLPTLFVDKVTVDVVGEDIVRFSMANQVQADNYVETMRCVMSTKHLKCLLTVLCGMLGHYPSPSQGTQQ